MAIVHKQTYGPFKLPVAVILRDRGAGKFTGEWLRASDLKKTQMVNNELTIFKFAAGHLITIEVSLGFGGRLEFCGHQGNTINPFRKDYALIGDGKMNLKVGIICGDVNCSPTSMVCPPGKPYARCVNGTLTCVAGEPPASAS